MFYEMCSYTLFLMRLLDCSSTFQSAWSFSYSIILVNAIEIFALTNATVYHQSIELTLATPEGSMRTPPRRNTPTTERRKRKKTMKRAARRQKASIPYNARPYT